MGIVLDYTSRIPPAALRAADVIGVCRYLAPLIERTRWKRITLDEYRELTAAGIVVTLNWEYDARDWLSGSAAGDSHAAQAVSQAQALGYPRGREIIGSCDFDMTRTQYMDIGRRYAQAFADGVERGGYRPGVYAPWDVLQWTHDDGIMSAFWQAGMSTAWSGGRNRNAWPGAHIRQRGHKTVGGVDTDWNEILIQPLWGGSTVEGKGGGLMRMIRKDSERDVKVYDEFGNYRWTVQDEPERDWLHRNGMELHDGVSDALFEALTMKVAMPAPSAEPVDLDVDALAGKVAARLVGGVEVTFTPAAG